MFICKIAETKQEKEDKWLPECIKVSLKCTFPLHEPSGAFPTPVSQTVFYSGWLLGLTSHQGIGGSGGRESCRTIRRWIDSWLYMSKTLKMPKLPLTHPLDYKCWLKSA